MISLSVKALTASFVVSKTLTNKVATIVRTWSVRSNDRRQLAQMSDRMLADIGLSRVDVAIETNKYFWQK